MGEGLEDGGGDLGGDLAFDGLVDDLGFLLAQGEQEDFFGLDDGVDADTDGLMGDVGDGTEIVLGVLAGYGVQIDQPGGGVKAGAGFVEAYMAVAANAQQLQVDTAKAGYFVFVGSAVLGDAVGRTVGVWDVYIIGLYIYMLKQILLHKVGVAVLVLGDNWIVLI